MTATSAAAVVAVDRGPRLDGDGARSLGAALASTADDPIARPPAPTAPPPTTAPAPAPVAAHGVLPVPEVLPADAYAPTPQVVLGTIEIPALDLVADLQRGITLTAIDRGPGWWPGTAMPGELGNVVVAGHRTTHSRPFRHLDALEPGDRVIFTTDAGRSTYEVRGVIVVPGDWIDIAAQSQAHTATLFACHPPGSAEERVVAKLRLLGTDGRPVDPDDALPAMDAEARSPDHTLVMRQPDGGDGAGAGRTPSDGG